MPRRCCVPGCKSNYLTSIRSHGPVTMFKFPKDEDLKNKWIRAIHRKDLTPTDNTGVCAIHFKPEDFRNSDNGVPRKRPRLRENVIPSIFPTFFNMNSRSSRRDPAIRRLKRAFERKNQKYLHIEADKIKTFENFLENFSEKLDLTNWHVLKNDMKVVFYRVVLTEDTGCEICSRIIITNDLHLKVILGQLELRFKDLEWVLRSSLKLVFWSQVAKVLSRYLNVETVPSQNRDYYLERALTFLNLANEYEFKYSSNIELLCNQITLIKKRKKKRYDVPALHMAFMIYSQSIPAYENLRKFLIMPCRRYLQSISSTAQPIQNNKTYSIDEMYLEHIIDNLEIRDRYVALLLYAINAGVDAFDPTITKTLIVFMIKSLYGSFKKVVRLVPISNPSGSDLKHLTIETINFVESLSFKVCVVTTDNNKTNQSLFKMLTENQSDKSVCNYFINPGNSEEIIYLQYDTVQIYKNIRNDWISLSNSGQTFFYPDFETGEVKSASFLHLKNIFSEEIDLPDKQAFKLNIKSLQPNGIERQNLALVENVFHPSTILALKQREGDMAETGEFCSIIRKWWDIMNVKGTLLRNQNTDDDKSPFYSSNDARIEYLDKFTSWLELWSSTEESGNGGILTRDTSNAAILTTKTVIDLMKYSFDDLQIDYVLPAMLQTDDLELHLRSYRGIEGQCIISYYTK